MKPSRDKGDPVVVRRCILARNEVLSIVQSYC